MAQNDFCAIAPPRFSQALAVIMKTLKWVLTTLVFLPWVFELLALLDSNHGLLWIFLETISYLPIYWLNEPFLITLK